MSTHGHAGRAVGRHGPDAAVYVLTMAEPPQTTLCVACRVDAPEADPDASPATVALFVLNTCERVGVAGVVANLCPVHLKVFASDITR